MTGSSHGSNSYQTPSSLQSSGNHRSSTRTTTDAGAKVARFCHECGNPFALPDIRFCCECGVKRLYCWATDALFNLLNMDLNVETLCYA